MPRTPRIPAVAPPTTVAKVRLGGEGGEEERDCCQMAVRRPAYGPSVTIRGWSGQSKRNCDKREPHGCQSKRVARWSLTGTAADSPAGILTHTPTNQDRRWPGAAPPPSCHTYHVCTSCVLWALADGPARPVRQKQQAGI